MTLVGKERPGQEKEMHRWQGLACGTSAAGACRGGERAGDNATLVTATWGLEDCLRHGLPTDGGRRRPHGAHLAQLADPGSQ